MDNASIHHVDGITELIHGVGAIPLFLLPYSPDFNPIEELFSKLKTTIKLYEFQDVQSDCLSKRTFLLWLDSAIKGGMSGGSSRLS